jgi:rRNA maturation RNase YbeY
MIDSNIQIEIRIESPSENYRKDIALTCRTAIEYSWETFRLQLANNHHLSSIDDKNIEISVVFINDESMYELNMKHRGKKKSTNVLSFPGDTLPPAPGATILLGDIALCWAVIEKEAVGFGIPVKNHLTHLTIHGVLHLLGYDHDSTCAAERMEQLECHILSTMGIESPYEVMED